MENYFCIANPPFGIEFKTGLISYDKVWVTGAHDATTIEISKPFVIGGKGIAAGKYAIFPTRTSVITDG